MAFYGVFGANGELESIERNPTPIPAGAVLLTKTEVFTLLSPGAAQLRRVGTDQFVEGSSLNLTPVEWPANAEVRDKLVQAFKWYNLTERIAQEFIEQRLAMQMGSTVITSTRIPQAWGLKLLEFRHQLRGLLLKKITAVDQIPTPPDD